MLLLTGEMVKFKLVWTGIAVQRTCLDGGDDQNSI